MKDAIRLERRIELAFEGHRFFDVRRWMIAEDTENMQMHGFEITKTITEKGKVVPVRKHTFRNFKGYIIRLYIILLCQFFQHSCKRLLIYMLLDTFTEIGTA